MKYMQIQVQLLVLLELFILHLVLLSLIKKIGVERRVHTAGKNKKYIDPFLDEKKEDIERLKNIQLDLHKDFIDVVEKVEVLNLKNQK